MNDLMQSIQLLKQALLFNKLKSMGVNKEYVEAIEILNNKETFASRDAKDGEYYYYWPEVVHENSRDFCKQMVKLGKVFSIQEINTMSTFMGYDVFEYQPGPIHQHGGPGGPECKHYWVRFRGKIISTPAPTDNQINTLINKSIFR